MHKGFTLVELSIVLVIIGLLIGGILLAQSMVTTTRITAATSQIQQFDAGVMNFRTKYNQLPGDSLIFGGDGDGVIDVTASTGYDDYNVGFLSEIANFWYTIDSTQFTRATPGIPGTRPISSGAGMNVPKSKFGKENSYVIGTAIGINATSADKVNPRNFYVVLDPSQAQTTGILSSYVFTPTSASNSAAKPADLLALDTKMDDSFATTGNIISGKISNAGGYGGATEGAVTSLCNNGTKYYSERNSHECTPLIRIGAQAGNPQ